MLIDFHPAASDEAECVHRWYAERSPIAAVRFREELDAAIAQIQGDPERGGSYLHGTALLSDAAISLSCRLPPPK